MDERLSFKVAFDTLKEKLDLVPALIAQFTESILNYTFINRKEVDFEY